MGLEHQAVFLSYASQDAEAARRICEALRAAGVEVWFDQSELRGGDAWDAKIRKQIKECALFVPVISANTQARREGYFRIEWKLAAQRTHAIAEGTPFLLPVVIDDTPEPEALVPGEFREVQWTGLAGSSGHPSEAGIATFCARVRGLLFDKLGAPVSSAAPVGTVGVRPARESRRRWRIPAVILVALVPGLLIWRPWQRFSSSGQRVGSPGSQIADQAYALTQKVTVTRDDLDAADALAQRALEREPESPRVWAVRAWIQAAYLERTLDFTRKRRDDAHSLAKRALVLNPDDADALNALARVMLEQESWSEAEKLAARAVQLAPDNQRSRLLQAAALAGQDRRAEARAMLEEAVRRRPTDVLARCELAENYAPLWRPGEPTAAQVATALEHLDTAIAQQPCEPALVAKAILAGSRLGDLAKMREALDALDKLPLAERTTDRAIYAAMWCGLLERNLPRVLAAAALTTRSYLSDTMVYLPKEHYVAMAYRMAGKEALAQQQWRIAEATMREQMRDHPTDGREPMLLALILASAGKREEAAREIGPTAAAWNEAMTPGHARNLAGYLAAMGDAEKAAPWIDRALNAQTYLTDHTLLLEPRWDGLRGHPAFEAVAEKARQRIARSKETKSGGAPVAPAADSKSVAVLAFRQLSGDPENEYLCEAISDELCSVLGRVPGLKVAASASAFSLKKSVLRPSEKAAQLGVAYLVDGSVQKIGNRVRVRAELIKAADESAVWKSDTLEHEVKDMFTVQDAVVGAIAKNLQLQLGAAPMAAVRIHPDAYRIYYEGRRVWSLRGTPEEVPRAQELFQKALELDPNLGRAYAGLVDTMLESSVTSQLGEISSRFGRRGSERMVEMLALAAKAVELEPDSAETHTAWARALWYTWQYSASERELRTALRLSPNHADAHGLLARLLNDDGRMDEGLQSMRTATELDPLTSRHFDNFSTILRDAGFHREALVQAERAFGLQPRSLQARRTKMAALTCLGRHDEAVAIARQPDVSRYAGITFAHAGFVADALNSIEGPTGSNITVRAAVLARLGRMEEAIKLLIPDETSALGLHYLLYQPELDPLRSDPRFVAYLTTLGIKEAHDRAQAWRAAHPPEKPAAKK